APVVGPTHPTTSMPTNAVLFPQAVSPEAARGAGRGDLAATGALGASYAPFIPGGTGQLLRNLRLTLTPDRFTDRRQLLTQFDELRRRVGTEPQFQEFDHNQRQACEALFSGQVANALDLSKESQRVVDRYDTRGYADRVVAERSARGRRGYYTGHALALGKL